MDNWKKFNETALPENEDFYIFLNMEDTRLLIQITRTQK